jgi:hypothetical protein
MYLWGRHSHLRLNWFRVIGERRSRPSADPVATWSYSWIILCARSAAPGTHSLCIDCDESGFAEILRAQTEDGEFQVTSARRDAGPIPYQADLAVPAKGWDRIIVAGLAPLLTDDDQRGLLGSLRRSVRSGGRIIIVTEYVIPDGMTSRPRRQADLRTNILQIGLWPEDPGNCDPIPNDPRIGTQWLNASDLLHICRKGSKHFPIGIALRKPYELPELLNTQFRVNRACRRLNARCLEVHPGVWPDVAAKTLWVPEQLLSADLIGVRDIGAFYRTSPRDAADLVNELVQYGILIEAHEPRGGQCV